jgi:hypothetical protein
MTGVIDESGLAWPVAVKGRRGPESLWLRSRRLTATLLVADLSIVTV